MRHLPVRSRAGRSTAARAMSPVGAGAQLGSRPNLDAVPPPSSDGRGLLAFLSLGGKVNMTRGKQDRPRKLVTCRPVEAAEAIGIGKTKMYELIKDGTVPHVFVGGFIRVPLEALQHLAQRIAHAPCAPPRLRCPAKDTLTK